MALAVLVFVCAVGPALMFIVNLRSYLPPPPIGGGADKAHISVLIPARNEEANISAALESVLTSAGVALEVLVLDDASTDATAAIVATVAARDTRVRLLRSAALPKGWNGKQHACWHLAQNSQAPVMLFLDADVRLEPDAIARMAAFQRSSGAALVSGFPRLVTIGFLEWLLLPLIHFVLLGFLPVERMRKTTDPAMAAGCGQFMMCQREAYFVSGGHEAIRATMHDGLLLPRTFRRAGFRTDLADLAALSHVRMYDSAAKVWQGLAKNATEGIADPKRIVPITLTLLLGQVAPTCLVLIAFLIGLYVQWHHMFIIGISRPFAAITWGTLFLIALLASFLPRLLAVHRFKQPLKSALLHPVGILLLLCVQWYALVRQLMGKPVGWRAREYGSRGGEEVS
ncbi:MAG: glycosyltransferase family 2 protein [Acidobacteriaceae bacterium]